MATKKQLEQRKVMKQSGWRITSKPRQHYTTSEEDLERGRVRRRIEDIREASRLEDELSDWEDDQ